MRRKRSGKGAAAGARPLRDAVLAAEPAALGRALTLAEREPARLAGALGDLGPLVGRAFRVGVTGPPGAGKSSILREVIRRLLGGGERAALVACDPSSPVTGGAFLGDRLRLAGLSGDPRLFVRSIAHRAPGAEPPPAARHAMDILDAAGFAWIFLETVGAGQTDSGALRGAHLGVLVHSPEGGDDLTMLKAGLVETADLHVVTRLDRPGTEAWAAALREAMGHPGGGGPPVLAASALTGEGVDALVEELKRRRALRAERGEEAAAGAGRSTS
jgi:LAO/AO transport system kinase